MSILRRIPSQVLLAAFLLASPIQAKENRLLSLRTTQLYATFYSSFYTVDVSNGQVTQKGDLGVSIIFLTYNPHKDVFYGLGSAGLYVIDRHKPSATLVGPLSVNNVGFFAYDWRNNVLFAGRNQYPFTAPPGLYKVNPETAEATLVGDFGEDLDAIGLNTLAFDAHGTLWALDQGLGNSFLNLYTVNTKTGAATYSTYDADVWNIVFDPISNVRYGIFYNPDGNNDANLFVPGYYPFLGESWPQGYMAFAIDGPHIERIP